MLEGDLFLEPVNWQCVERRTPSQQLQPLVWAMVRVWVRARVRIRVKVRVKVGVRASPWLARG